MRGQQLGGPRDLRTLLFTDIVGSTERAASLGDRAWGDLLARHHAVVRAALQHTGGREIDTAGDGFFASFARPSEALACASELVRGVAALGLLVRAGLHAGEVETRGGKASGITVHVAARLMAAAGPNDVLVSATIRDLAAGAGWTFVDRGQLELKGLAEPIHAFALDLETGPAMPIARVGVGATVTSHRLGISVLTAGALLAVVAFALASAGAIGRGAEPTLPASPAAVVPSGSPEPSAVSTSQPSDAAEDSPGAGTPIDVFDRGVLKPGLYTAAALPGTPTLTVADPGWSLFYSGSGNLAFERTSSPNDRFTLRWLNALTRDACGQQPMVVIGPDPEAQFLAWARAAKGLQLSSGVPRLFGDLAATELDVSVVDKYACQYTTPGSVAVTGNEGEGGFETAGPLLLYAGEKFRLEAGSRQSRLILIIFEAPSSTEFASFAPLAETLLGTLHFGP